MSQRKKKIIIVIIAVVAAFFIGIVLGQWSAYNGAPSESIGFSSSSGVHAFSPTHSAVPPDSVVPQKGATSAAVGVAVPVVQGPGDPSGNVEYRSFDLTIQKNAFSPSTVIVNQGDIVDLEITAVDGNYAFTQPDYGFNAPIKKGRTQRIQFQALQSGDFTFYCASCGGPSSGPVGHLIVVASQ